MLEGFRNLFSAGPVPYADPKSSIPLSAVLRHDWMVAIEPLFIANWIARRKLFGWNTLSTDGFAVTASSGIQTPVDYPLGTTEHFDTVLVLASFEARQAATDGRLLK